MTAITNDLTIADRIDAVRADVAMMRNRYRDAIRRDQPMVAWDIADELADTAGELAGIAHVIKTDVATRLVADGTSLRTAGDVLGVSHTTVAKYATRANIAGASS